MLRKLIKRFSGGTIANWLKIIPNLIKKKHSTSVLSIFTCVNWINFKLCELFEIELPWDVLTYSNKLIYKTNDHFNAN